MPYSGITVMILIDIDCFKGKKMHVRLPPIVGNQNKIPESNGGYGAWLGLAQNFERKKEKKKKSQLLI